MLGIPTWTMLQWLARDEKKCLSTVIIGRRHLLRRKRHWMHVLPRAESLCWSVGKREWENWRKNPDTGQMGGYSSSLLYLSKGLNMWGQAAGSGSGLYVRLSLWSRLGNTCNFTLLHGAKRNCLLSHRGHLTSQKKDSAAHGHHAWLRLSPQT